MLLHGVCCEGRAGSSVGAPISATLRQARALLEGAGAGVTVELRAGDAGPGARPQRARDGAGFSRRDLLRALRREPPAGPGAAAASTPAAAPSRTAPSTPAERDPSPPDERAPSAPAERSDPALPGPPAVPAATAPRGVLLAGLPSAPVPIPEAQPGCTGCRVCERLCPADALQWQDTRDGGRLTVTPADCITCGLCVRSCPEDVLGLSATAPVSGPTERVVSITQPRCDRCRATLNPHDQRLCTACRSRESLLEDVLAQDERR